MLEKKYFSVDVSKYDSNKDFSVHRPASLHNPKDNAVMFITKECIGQDSVLSDVSNCLIFWPDTVPVKKSISTSNAVIPCEDPRLKYCQFFKENQISALPQKTKCHMMDGAYISENAIIGENTVIMPGAYIGSEVDIGNNVYIGSGVKLMGEITIGNNVIIRENTVIGMDGLTTNRDDEGKSVVMPQFGNVIIEDDVQIGGGTIIARGAIDSTIICTGCRIDNACFISHNVEIGSDTFIVGESIVSGSCLIGSGVMIYSNVTIRNGISIGSNSIIGMGAVVTKSVPAGVTVKGNPAK